MKSYYKQKPENGNEEFLEMEPNTSYGVIDWGALEKTSLENNSLLQQLLVKGKWEGGFLVRYRQNPYGEMVYDGLLKPNGELVGTTFDDLNYGKIVSIGDFEDGCFDIVLEKDGQRDESCVLLANGRRVSDKGFGSHKKLKDTIAKIYNLPGEKGVPSTMELADISFTLLNPNVSKKDAEKIVDNISSYMYSLMYKTSSANAEVFSMHDELQSKLKNAECFADVIEVMAKQKTFDAKVDEAKLKAAEASVEMADALEKAKYVGSSFKKLTAMKNDL